MNQQKQQNSDQELSSSSEGPFKDPNDRLWEFVPVSDYQLPGHSAHSAATMFWAYLKGLSKRSVGMASEPFIREPYLRYLPETRLKHLAPPIDWSIPAQSLNETLQAWLNFPEPDQPIKFVIGQPFTEHAQIVRLWAEMNEATLIEAPSVDQILSGDQSWFDSWPGEPSVWALPNLEHCYLRHINGLNLVRQFLEHAQMGRLGKGVIGCDSWAWAYLQRIWPVPRPDALTIQAFDGARLVRLLCGLMAPRQGMRIRFRNAATGKEIFSAPFEDEQINDEMIQLAAHCRGNVGAAIRYWRERLRSEPELDKAKSENFDTGQKQLPAHEEIVWVAAGLPEPILPVGTDEDTVLTLHTLLLHGGAPESVLSELLPFSSSGCMALLIRLRNAGIVECRQGRWNVHELAYAVVRSLLKTRDYLIDDF